MRLPADENIPGKIIRISAKQGHDVVWARTDCAEWKDTALLELAESDARILLTLDKDFWQIAIQRPAAMKRAGVVLFRTHPATLWNLDPLVRAFAVARLQWAGHVSIVTAGDIQMLSVKNS